jgi:dTDP-4-dehydrorhamnose 3,5-epimerase
MKFTETELEGVVIVEPVRYEDARGWFMETFSQREFGDRAVFVQDNEVWSRRGAVRGLHCQRGADAQAKLVRAVRGRILDVAVDVRPGSPTWGRHVAVELSDENRRQLFVPHGFLHGYSVLSDEALVAYKCDNFYTPASEAGVRYDDPALGIDWGLPASERLVSDRDMALPLLKDAKL